MEAAAKLQPVDGPDRGSSVAELTPGQAFAGRYACVRKDRLTARNGSGYLSLELRDRTGSVPARLFREPDRIGSRFERGAAVPGRGRAQRLRRPPLVQLAGV